MQDLFTSTPECALAMPRFISCCKPLHLGNNKASKVMATIEYARVSLTRYHCCAPLEAQNIIKVESNQKE